MAFDEINKLSGKKRRSEPYDEYFSDMDLTEEQKQERISFSEDTEDFIKLVIALILAMSNYNAIDEDFITEQTTSYYLAVIGSYMDIDDYLNQYASDFSADFVATTLGNISDEWYTSDDRAMFDAENEANTVLNYKDYIKAIASGKTQKTWITYGDNRVRKTHKRLDGKTIPIKSLFEVGDSFMRYPKDMKFNPKPEFYIGCRCSLKYS